MGSLGLPFSSRLKGRGGILDSDTTYKSHQTALGSFPVYYPILGSVQYSPVEASVKQRALYSGKITKMAIFLHTNTLSAGSIITFKLRRNGVSFDTLMTVTEASLNGVVSADLSASFLKDEDVNVIAERTAGASGDGNWALGFQVKYN